MKSSYEATPVVTLQGKTFDPIASPGGAHLAMSVPQTSRDHVRINPRNLFSVAGCISNTPRIRRDV